MIFSFLMWFPWWVRHGAMDTLSETLFRENAENDRLKFRGGRSVLALPSSSPCAGLSPFSSESAFLVPCPFMVCPLWAKCVGVGVGVLFPLSSLAFPFPFPG